jgi:hypothetical protein
MRKQGIMIVKINAKNKIKYLLCADRGPGLGVDFYQGCQGGIGAYWMSFNAVPHGLLCAKNASAGQESALRRRVLLC